ncbi:heavy-metal-associated domain-containing protein [Sphingomonas sp.]|uniref:heavy-metal-associated domain-containing protein n=1 Tax=Sphingomonas sp. TaxID=28214 RepID=UPI003AFF933A
MTPSGSLRARLRAPAPRGKVAAAIAGVAAIALGTMWASAQLAPGERGVPPIDSSSNLEVAGVRVDVAGRTAEEARSAGWREAQRRGWKILYARAHGMAPDAVPGLPDGTLDAIVAGIEVENEQIGPHRYIASLGILFDRGRANQYLGGGGQAPRSSPMLVIPVQYGGGGPQSFEARTDWQKAWARFRAGVSPVDYVRPVGTAPDPVLLQLGQTRRPGRLWWRALLDQYGAADIVVPEVWIRRRWPGGPVWARFVARHGPDATPLGAFVLTAPSTEALPAMLDEGVRRLDALYVDALGRGELSPDPSLTIEEPEAPPDEAASATDAEDPLAAAPAAEGVTLQVQVETPDAAALDAAQAALRGVPGVGQATPASLALGGTSLLTVDFAGEVSALRTTLASRGWRLEGEGGTVRLRRAPPAPPPPPPPAP